MKKLAVTIYFLLGFNQAYAAVLGFDDLALGTRTDNLIYQGFVLDETYIENLGGYGPVTVDSSVSPPSSLIDSNGLFGLGFEVTAVEGGAFNFISALVQTANDIDTITFLGYRDSNLVFNQSVMGLPSINPPILFDTSIASINRLVVYGDSIGTFMLDDLSLDTVDVNEPSTLALSLMSLFALGALRRKSQRKSLI